MNPFHAVLFDMDGVIVDSRSAIEYAWGEVLTRYTGRVLDEKTIEEQVHGRTGSHTVAALFPDHTPDQHKEIWAAVDAIEETAPYSMIPGIREFLADLGRAGFTVGLVTSSWPAKIAHVVGLLALDSPFSIVVSRDDVSHGKPHPEPYLKGCEQLGVAPESTLVFEDSLSGVRSAVAAGTRCVGIGGDELVDAGALAAVPDFRGLKIVESGPAAAQITGLSTPLDFRLDG